MFNLFTCTLIICVVIVFSTMIILATIKQYMSVMMAIIRVELKLVTPIDALRGDLGRVFSDIRERLGRDWKGDSFPMKFPIGEHSTWAGQKSVMEIVPALLERDGWVVWRTPDCKKYEIMIDFPRKKFPEQKREAGEVITSSGPIHTHVGSGLLA